MEALSEFDRTGLAAKIPIGRKKDFVQIGHNTSAVLPVGDADMDFYKKLSSKVTLTPAELVSRPRGTPGNLAATITLSQVPKASTIILGVVVLPLQSRIVA